MPTAARKAAATKPAETPAPTTKAKPTELERAQAAYDKAKAKTDKSQEKVTKAETDLEAAKNQLAIDKRTSDYLYMHPALAEAREKTGGNTDEPPTSEPAAPAYVLGEGEAHGVSGIVDEPAAADSDAVSADDPFASALEDKDESPADPFSANEEKAWGDAAPSGPVSDPFADNMPAEAGSRDLTDPFGG